MDQVFQQVATNGIHLRVALSGPEDGPLVLLVHGFPESWYSWRHQLKAFGEAGYRVAAPDVRGYGGSDKPHAVEAYDMQNMAADMAGVAEALSPDAPAVVIGHDWGAPIAWNSALLHPDRFRAVAGLSVPHMPQGEYSFIDVVDMLYTKQGHFFYQVYFQEEGPAEAELEADPAATIRKFYYSVSGDAPDGAYPNDKKHGDILLTGMPEPDLPLPWLSEEDVAYYAGEFASSGFRGPLNRYRNHRRDHAYLRAASDQIIHQPSFFIGGSKDPVLRMVPGRDPLALMKPALPGLKGAHILEGCGHWTQQERTDEVNELLLGWLGGL